MHSIKIISHFIPCRKNNAIASPTFLHAMRILIACALIHITFDSIAQDIHFSQFYQSPFNLNPGLTGQFTGAYRLIGNQRTQWRSVTVPYSTFGLSADASKLELPDGFLNKKDGQALTTNWNTGISFFNDKAGDSHLKTSVLNLALGRDFPVGNDGISRISTGMMIGVTSMKIDYSELRYDNQWTGIIYDPGINADEQYPRSTRSYVNINAGIAYFKTWSRKKEMTIGVALMNIGNPSQSFFNDGYVKLDMRLNVHGGYKFAIKERWLAEPMVLFMTQGTYKEVNFGGLAHYILEENSWMWRSFYAGIFGRARDAGYVVAGLQYDAWNVGISYDINTSNLKPASNGRGGFEFSAVYIIPKAPRLIPIKVCKDYM